jgi:hypothetical protein
MTVNYYLFIYDKFSYGFFPVSSYTPFHFNPLYSYLSIAKGVNVRWALGCKAGNPDLAIPKIWSFYFPNFEE